MADQPTPEIRWVTNIGTRLYERICIEIGDPDDAGYQKITQEPCKYCKTMTMVEDIAYGYPTMIAEPICIKCSIPGLAFLKDQ